MDVLNPLTLRRDMERLVRLAAVTFLSIKVSVASHTPTIQQHHHGFEFLYSVFILLECVFLTTARLKRVLST